MRKGAIIICSIVGVIGLSVGTLVLTKESTGTSLHCTAKPVSYAAIIKDGTVTPNTIDAKLCGTLTITNQDAIAREIAFGEHDKHVAYDGIGEKVLNQGQSLTITFNKTGSFHFHDHLHDEVEGFFTITK